MLEDICQRLEYQLPLPNAHILEEFDLLDGHPWAWMARSPITTYYSCLYGLVAAEKPRRILEIGTAFGMSAATCLKASPALQLFISLDLGIYGDQLGAKENNLVFAQDRVHRWLERQGLPTTIARFYRANTQPIGKGDNENLGLDVPRWHQIPELVRLLQSYEFDVMFVDGKHTEDGLLNDMVTFWPFLKPGGLLICDDLHDPVKYAQYAKILPWVGDTWRSYHQFIESHCAEISDYYIWEFPQVPPGGKSGLRPFGLIRKAPTRYPLIQSPGFEMFDAEDAMHLNYARLDHLASLGLELAGKSVLEVEAGVGWHTGFFEKLGCSVLSTDGRLKNVVEHLHRFPYRQGRVVVADLSLPSSYNQFGQFDVVYCYGTLYHLADPTLCLRELAQHCGELFLLETCVFHEDNGQINPIAENAANPNQSLHGVGCRPGRDWIMAELRKHFPFVYHTVTQPNHPDFELEWPAPAKSPGNNRAIFVASRHPLNLPTLSPTLLNRQARLLPIFTITQLENPDSIRTGHHRQEEDTTETQIICERIGRMLNRLSPISEAELHIAAEALIELLGTSDVLAHLETVRGRLPAAVIPLLILNLARAWSEGDALLAEVLERAYGLISHYQY
ncbi:MAG: class I SAM-dependent methyltransferase [Anaerolineae bacterium]|nr:class I SAM-dependent methyltransferase [Anaerolineae bacterium]